jgi:hypothetical protein
LDISDVAIYPMEFNKYFDTTLENLCRYCTDELTKDNFVLYKDTEGGIWMPCIYCRTCVGYMIRTQWQEYINMVDNADCKKELYRLLLEDGPPINFRDTSIKCNNTSSEVYKFYHSNQEQPAKLEGSLTGQEREDWLKQKILLYIDIDL